MRKVAAKTSPRAMARWRSVLPLRSVTSRLHLLETRVLAMPSFLLINARLRGMVPRSSSSSSFRGNWRREKNGGVIIFNMSSWWLWGIERKREGERGAERKGEKEEEEGERNEVGKRRREREEEEEGEGGGGGGRSLHQSCVQWWTWKPRLLFDAVLPGATDIVNEPWTCHKAKERWDQQNQPYQDHSMNKKSFIKISKDFLSRLHY